MSVFKYFKNIPRSPSHRATGPMCNFFFQICNEVPGEKKNKPCRPLGGRQPPPFFFSRNFVENLKKKNYNLGLSPYGRATGVYF